MVSESPPPEDAPDGEGDASGGGRGGDSREPLNPSGIAEVVQFGRSEVYASLKFRGHPSNDRDEPPVSDQKLAEPNFAPAPALVELGNVYEAETVERLADDAALVRAGRGDGDSAFDDYTDVRVVDDLDLADLVDVVERVARGELDGPALLANIDLAGRIEAWPVAGEADLIVVWPAAADEDAEVHVRVLEIKAGDEKPHHQIQATLYAMLADDALAARVDAAHAVSAGVIDGEGDPDGLVPGELPTFDIRTRRGDIVRLFTEDDGLLARAFEGDDLPPHELGKVARESKFGEYLMINAIEERDIRLLGLSLTEQQAYREQGLDTLEDVAELVEVPVEPKPYADPPAIESGHEETVAELNGNVCVDERVQLTAQRAQAMLGRLHPDHSHANPEIAADENAEWVWLQGSGDADLPEDDPPFDATFNIPRGSLIRVYLDVQYDPLNERALMLSAALYCQGLDDTGWKEDRRKVVESFSTLIDDFPQPGEAYETAEGRLVSEFADVLFDELAAMGDRLDESSIHFFTHTAGEHRVLADALRRHADRDRRCRVLRNLFDLRGAVNGEELDPDEPTPELKARATLESLHTPVEQRMVSHVRPALRDHVALAEPGGHGVPRTHDRLKYHDREFWRHDRGDETTVDLRNAFAYEFLSRAAPCRLGDDGTIEFVADAEDGTGYCLSRPRDDSNLPLEYFWGAADVDEPYESWKDTEEGFAGLANRFLYWYEHEEAGEPTKHPIRREDIEALGERLAVALCDVENELAYCRTPINQDPVEKHPLPTAQTGLDAATDGRDDPTLAEACRDVVDLEYAAGRREHENRLDRPVLERIRKGRAFPVEVTNTPDEDDAGRFMAELAYDHPDLDLDDPEFLERANRVGDVVVSSQLDASGGELTVDEDKWYPRNGPQLHVDHLDEDTGVVNLSEDNTNLYRRQKREVDDPYIEHHHNLLLNADNPSGPNAGVMEGDLLLLDEGRLTYTALRSRRAINGVDGNPLYELLESIRTDDHAPADLRTSAFGLPGVEAFLDELEAAVAASDDEDFISPNEKQREYIEKTDARLSLLQGPPGTGKTDGVLANGLLSRASAREAADDLLAALVVGPTNGAIDKAMEATADQRDRCVDHGVGDVADVQFVRLHPSRTPPDGETRDDVLHLSAKNAGLLRDHLRSDSTIVFATPQTVHKLVVQLADADTAAAAHSNSPELFDLLVMDEASMMRLPQVVMASAPITYDAQVMVAGDHRQMPPVQQHGWLAEDRLSTARTGAFCSALNYLRFLRGEPVERIERSDHVTAESPAADGIEMTRLKKTYRCHLTVTEFLRRQTYAQDGIEYTSEEDAVLTETDGDVSGALAAVFGESPLVLITHDDRDSHQHNETEAHLVAGIADLVPDDVSVGVVAPHNKQKATTRSLTADDVTADTVERFQGREEDLILVTATASDPSYLDELTEFLMNPNRLTVALSRMKKKLVVLAPESLFELIPEDTDEYDDSGIWKGMHKIVTADGPVASECSSETGVNYRVHTFDGYDDRPGV